MAGAQPRSGREPGGGGYWFIEGLTAGPNSGRGDVRKGRAAASSLSWALRSPSPTGLDGPGNARLRTDVGAGRETPMVPEGSRRSTLDGPAGGLPAGVVSAATGARS